MILAIFTLILGGIAVFIGLRLQQTTPDDSFVSGNLGEACNGNASGTCRASCLNGEQVGGGSCNSGQGVCCVAQTTTDCTPQYSNGCVTIPAGCTNTVTCTVYSGPNDSPFCNENTISEGVVVSAGNPLCSSPQCGECRQIDCQPGQGGTRVNNDSVCSSSTTSTPRTTTTRTTTTTTVVTTTSATPDLPKTALVSDDVDRVLIALGVLIFGYVAVRFRLLDSLFIEFSQSRTAKPNKKDRSRSDYERRFDDEDK